MAVALHDYAGKEIHGVLLYDANGDPLLFDSQGVRASIYGKSVTAGDTPVKVDADGHLQADILAANITQLGGQNIQQNSGRIQVGLFDTNGTQVNAASEGDAANQGSDMLKVLAKQAGYNGATWDRWYNNMQGTLLAGEARSSSVNSADQTNHNARGVYVFVKVTAVVDTPSITLSIWGKDPISGQKYTLVQFAAFTPLTPDYMAYLIYPGASESIASAELTIQALPLPRIWGITLTHGDSDVITYSVGYSYVQ